MNDIYSPLINFIASTDKSDNEFSNKIELLEEKEILEIRLRIRQ